MKPGKRGPVRRRLIRRSTGSWGALAAVGLLFVVLVLSQSGHRADAPALAPGVGPPTSVSTAASSGIPIGFTPTSSLGAPATVAMPDPRLTPGETFTGVTAAEVCTPGWAGSHRRVATAQYREVYALYGISYPEPSGTYELDHLIPLELGGDDANANLWPEPSTPMPGFHQKDQLENVMHDRVCAGSLALIDAQHQIASNWYAAYVKYVAG